MPHTAPPLSLLRTALLAVVAIGGYAVAFGTAHGGAAVLIALPCILLLARMATARRTFYLGLLISIAIYAPHLAFFARIFGPPAALLWLVAGLPLTIFLLLLHVTRRRLGDTAALWLAPVFWTGLEYFRSEAYYLKFSWLIPGQAVAFLPGVRLARIGVYGLGFVCVLFASMAIHPRRAFRVAGITLLIMLGITMYFPPLPAAQNGSALHVAGVQLEGADERQVAAALEQLAIAHPEAQILVLSEYTYSGLVPPSARDVLRRYHRYLIAGGTRPLADGKFHDTAFVVGPDGEDLFEQAKSVPVQFMDDGLPATKQRVWQSPWGNIGIAICYDLGYADKMDQFIQQGAGALIVPTMDMQDWGDYERRMLHGRLAPIRSAEYGIPTFGVWSSGRSQLTDRGGRILATAGYPGQGDMLAGPLDSTHPGHIPPDRWPARAAMGFTGAFIVFLFIASLNQRRKR